MGMIINYDGKSYDLPFSDDCPFVQKAPKRLPDRVAIRFDERDFDRYVGRHAIWTSGAGLYLVLAYCGSGLTVTRHRTLKAAIQAKRPIDGTGCGGSCYRAH